MHDTPEPDSPHHSLQSLDDELLARVRAGQPAALGSLFERHVDAALRLARYLAPPHESDDIVSEAFACVLDQIRRGRGPDRAFRAYLMTSVRHEAYRRNRLRKRFVPTEDLGAMSDAASPEEGIDGFERSIVRDAFTSLPTRWRTVLWHLDVEGRKPREIASTLGISANGVSALAYRARAGLREAYLRHHLRPGRPDRADGCEGRRPEIAALLRAHQSSRERARTLEHLNRCVSCLMAYIELKEVDSTIAEPPNWE